MQERADRPLLSAAAMLGDRIEPLPSRVVLVFDETNVPRRRRRRDPAPFRQVAVTGDRPAVAVVATVGPGAPTAAVSVEFLAHLGVRSMVAVGVAGDLVPDRSCAAVFPVAGSVSQDGTSIRYRSAPEANPELTEQLGVAVGHRAVTALTTDTPLLHTATDIDRFRERAELIEMETSALFAASAHLGLHCGALLVSSDRYLRSSWEPGDPAATKRAVGAAVDTAVSVLKRFDPDGGRRP